MSGVQTITVGEDETGMRLDRWFRAHYPQLTHGRLEKLLRKGEVRVSGGRAKSNRRLEAGDIVRVPPLDAKTAKKAPPGLARRDAERAIDEMRVYEDDDILAVNKPFGLAVQGGTKTTKHVDALLQALGGEDARPRLVHRLDKDTGGLLLTAKTRAAAQKLTAAFRAHDVEKTYWALCAGAPRVSDGSIDMGVAKRMVRFHDGEEERIVPAEGEDAKRALSLFQTVEQAGAVSFLALSPVTGRTHQLRVHMAAMGCPIVGDGKYGGAAARIEGISPKLHLFCRAMRFAHPRTGRMMTLKAPLTGHMKETWSFFSFDAAVDIDWSDEKA